VPVRRSDAQSAADVDVYFEVSGIFFGALELGVGHGPAVDWPSLTRRMSLHWLPGMDVDQLEAVLHAARAERGQKVGICGDEQPELGLLAPPSRKAARNLRGEELDQHPRRGRTRRRAEWTQDQLELVEILAHGMMGGRAGGEDQRLDVARIL